MNKNQAACHESAHAVTQYLLGIHIKKLLIVFGPNEWEGFLESNQHHLYEPPHLKAIIALAGQFGYQLADPNCTNLSENFYETNMGIQKDLYNASSLCECAVRMSGFIGESPVNKAQQLNTFLQNIAQKLTDQNRTSIINLAQELQLHGKNQCCSMTEKEIMSFLDQQGLQFEMKQKDVTDETDNFMRRNLNLPPKE